MMKKKVLRFCVLCLWAGVVIRAENKKKNTNNTGGWGGGAGGGLVKLTSKTFFF